MKLEDFLDRFAMASGEHILAIDEERALMFDAKAAIEAADASAARAPTGISVVPLVGSVSARSSWGGTSLDAFGARVMSATNNPDVAAIVLDVNSPGGTYSGTPEAADIVGKAAKSKPVYALVSSLALSAAYFIASQAGQVVVTPSGEVGSIGVLSIHLDWSKALESDGVRPTVIRSVPFKAEANMFEPLTEEAQAAIQADVMEAHGVFVRAVASGRKTSVDKVNSDFGRGRVVSATQAVAAGMADRVGTMADVLAGMRTSGGGYRRRASFAFRD